MKQIIIYYLKKLDFTKYQLRIQIVLTGILGGAFSAALGWMAAWGLIPGLDIATVSSGAAGAIAAALSGVVVAIANALVVRVIAILNAAGELPQVEKVLLKTDEAAMDVPSEKVVGPSGQ